MKHKEKNLCTSSYSGPSEKEKALIRGGKAEGGVAEVQEADEVSARSSPGGETPGNQSNICMFLVEKWYGFAANHGFNKYFLRGAGP